MKIMVVGPGAIGCLLSAYLARAGTEVCLLDYDPERACRIQDAGVRVEGERGRFRVPLEVTADAVRTRTVEMLIVCVKAVDTEAVAARLAGEIPSECSLLTLQNGMGSVEKLGEWFGEKRVFAGVTSHGATLLDVGHVRHAGYGEIWMGPPDGQGRDPGAGSKLQQLALALNQAGLQARVVDDMHTRVWRKLVVNVGINALTAVLGVENGALPGIPECRTLMEEAITEAVQVARLCGVEMQTGEEIERVRAVCRSTASNVSSMLQDVRRGKRTEIDHLNGAVVRMAAGYGVDAPTNRMLTALVKRLEGG
jgi:2-dehydropantoate 2-reductase